MSRRAIGRRALHDVRLIRVRTGAHHDPPPTLGTGLARTNQPAGLVLSQDPVAGTKVPGSTAVRLAVSKGPEMVTVPALRGLSLENATQKLADVGLTARIIRVSSSQPAGTVIAQDPAGGQKVKKGSAVRMNVSEGPATTTGGGTTVTVTVTTLTDTTAIP